MDNLRYIGLDVHRDTISAAVLNHEGQLLMQSVVPTRAPAILELLDGIRGTLHVTFEEGIHSAWLYDLLLRRVARVLVCDPRKTRLLKSGNKGDLIDARKLAELLRNDALSPVYHGELSSLEVQRRTRSYTMLTEDTTRIMSRVKAVFRGQAIPYHGKSIYRPDRRESYLAQLPTEGLRQRVALLYQELDAVHRLRLRAKREMLAECRKHPAMKWLQSVPFLGKVRTAVLIGRVQTPHRFRTKRQFWSYCGLALETHDSAQYHVLHGQVERKPRFVQVRGLNWNHNHDLKDVFKSAATMMDYRGEGKSSRSMAQPSRSDFLSDCEIVSKRALKDFPALWRVFHQQILELEGEEWNAVKPSVKAQIVARVGSEFARSGLYPVASYFRVNR